MKNNFAKLACVLILTMAMLLAACAPGTPAPAVPTTGQQAATPQPGQSAAATQNEPAAEPVNIYVTWMTSGRFPTDLLMVEERANEYIINELNARITLLPMTIHERATTIQLMIASGEQLDLMMSTFNAGIGPYVNRGQILPLNDLFERYGAGIAASQGTTMAGGLFGGTLYAIPTTEFAGRNLGLVLRRDMVEKYGLENLENVTYEELDSFFARVQEGEGDGFFMLAMGGSNIHNFSNFHPIDMLGSSQASGVLMNGGRYDTIIVNVFATEEYRTHVEWLRRWALAGYIQRDAMTITGSNTDLMRTGNFLGLPTRMEIGSPESLSNSVGKEMVGVSFAGKVGTTDLYQAAMWTIPITSGNPAMAMQVLNLMYSSEYLTNLLTFGIEGLHYVKTDDPGIISLPERVSSAEVGYFAMQHWGNNSTRFRFTPVESSFFEELALFNASIDDSVVSLALGYTYDPSDFSTEFALVTDVIVRYRAALESGAVDPATVMPEFLAALEAAGIYRLIADNQARLDEWLAMNN